MRLKIELRCILIPLIVLEMFRPPVVNSIDWTWFGKAHTCLYKLPQLTVHVRTKTKPWVWRNWENLPEGQASLQHFTNKVEGPNGSHSSIRHITARLDFAKKHQKDSREHEKQDSLVWWNQDWTIWPESQASRLEETWHPPQSEAWWWQHHAVGMFFSGRDWETS
jgi:hypothetical protein